MPPLKLLLDVRVRWNSTHAMLVRFIKFRGPLLELTTKHTQACGDCFIPPHDFDHLSDVVHSLSKFTEGTEILSGSKWPTAIYALPVIKSISSDLRRTNGEGSRPVTKYFVFMDEPKVCLFSSFSVFKKYCSFCSRETRNRAAGSLLVQLTLTPPKCTSCFRV